MMPFAPVHESFGQLSTGHVGHARLQVLTTSMLNFIGCSARRHRTRGDSFR